MRRYVTYALLALVLCGFAMGVAGQHYYEPDQPGHGLTVQAVDDGYAAQWYAHDGEQQRWFASNVCGYGESCDVWVADANGFPAVGSQLVEAGHIVLDRLEGELLLTYDLFIERVDCGGVMVGPLPPDCRGPDGERLWDVVLQPGLDESGAVKLERLVD